MSTPDDYSFSMTLEVRDYECDLQGIVNNSVYLNYLEHVRHKYLQSIGINFGEYAQQGINLVVVRAELDYKFPLSSGDQFWVGLKMAQESRVRFAFYQDIFRVPDHQVVLQAKIIGTALNAQGRPIKVDQLALGQN